MARDGDFKGRAAEIAALREGTDLGPLHTLPDFAEWRSNPITVELLARIDAKATHAAKVLDEKFTPAPGFTLTPEGRDKKSWNQGVIDGFSAVLGLAAP